MSNWATEHLIVIPIGFSKEDAETVIETVTETIIEGMES